MDILFSGDGMATVLMKVATNDVDIKMKQEAAAKAGELPAEEEDLTIIKNADGEAVTNEAATDTAADTVAADETATADTTDAAATETATEGVDAAVTEETVSDVETAESEMPVEEGPVDDAMAKEGAMDGSYVDPNYMGETGEGMYVDPNMPKIKDPLLSNWIFVIGISAAVLAVSVVLGILLAKRKIKKGIELYED